MDEDHVSHAKIMIMNEFSYLLQGLTSWIPGWTAVNWGGGGGVGCVRLVAGWQGRKGCVCVHDGTGLCVVTGLDCHSWSQRDDDFSPCFLSLQHDDMMTIGSGRGYRT